MFLQALYTRLTIQNNSAIKNFLPYYTVSTCYTHSIIHQFFTRSHSVSTQKYESSRIGYFPPKELRIPAPWGHIAAKQWGNPNGNPVLAVHGWQDNAGTFDTLAPLLPSHWNLVCIDLPGHGQSSHFPKGFSYYLLENVAAIVRVVSFLQWKQFNYIGHSLGAAVGFLYSGIYPETVDHFVSIDLIKILTLAGSSPELQRHLANFYLNSVKYENEDSASAPTLSVDEAIKRIIEKQEQSLTEESVKILMKRGAEILPEGKVRFTRDRKLLLPLWIVLPLCTEGYNEFIEAMRCKLLIIKSKGGPWYEDKEVYKQARESYRKYCKEFKYIEVDGTHHVHLNTPEIVLEHIIQFMN